MRKLLLLYSSYNRRASALIGTLVMVGILALAVGVMLSSSTMAIRGSRDKILYEEAYQAAVSGTHIARAWLINPELTKSMADESWDSDLEKLVDDAKKMNEKIIDDKYLPTSSLYGTDRIEDDFGEHFSLNQTLPDGRKVIYEFELKRPLVSFVNDSENKKFTDNLFQGTPAGGHKNYVDMLRITTAGTTKETSASLRETTFIVEARGVAEYAGTKKERTVQQRILIYPNEPSAPLLSSGESIITRGDLAIQGKSHGNVHWAPVLASGDINLDFLSKLVAPTVPGGDWTLNTLSQANKKYNGAGAWTNDNPQGFSGDPVEKWLSWMAGENGQLLDVDGNNIFGNVKDSAGNPIAITDFFADLYDGGIENAAGLTMDTLSLLGEFANAGTTLDSIDASNGLIHQDDDGTIEGALVQGSSAVDEKIEQFFDTMKYDELKQYAKDHSGYYTYDGSVLKDAAGNTVKNLPDMKSQVETLVGNGYYDPLVNEGINDRIIFVDGPNQADDDNDVLPNPEFTGTIPMPKFWKGVLYINGAVEITGLNAQKMKVRTPDQFKAFRAGTSLPSGTPESYEIENVFLDGILVANGTAFLKSNVAVYGTLAARDSVELGGTPSVFYNSANGEGRLKDDDSQNALYRVIAGRLYETGS